MCTIVTRTKLSAPRRFVRTTFNLETVLCSKERLHHGHKCVCAGQWDGATRIGIMNFCNKFMIKFVVLADDCIFFYKLLLWMSLGLVLSGPNCILWRKQK